MSYQAPQTDIEFLLFDVFDAPKFWAETPKLAELVDEETAKAVLEGAGKFMSGVVEPLNEPGDKQGVRIEDGKVIAADGFAEAYKDYCDNGWHALAGDPEYGGSGFPKVLTGQVEEMLQAASMAFGLAPMLTAGACLSIRAHASDEIKSLYLPKMYSGEWAGTMNLTEPHAGTDLGIIRAKAEENGDGSYAISGTKIFITWGEHEMTDNIVHLVLAKLPDAPAGSRGISLFLVPKFLVDENGNIGERNGVTVGSVEHKMGIHASPTCVMNYDNAKGWLIGEPNQGLACMFTMMNYERLVVGVQALGAADHAYQKAAAYAKDRLQGRSPTGAQNPEQAADPLLVHPDVRRMLMDVRVRNEGSRAFSTYVAKFLDETKFSESPEQRAKAERMVALLTPVAKAFMTDLALQSTVDAQQVFGGHGFIQEWGVEQLVRDTRITQIYEGANGIQAMDLLGRKVLMDGGQLIGEFIKEIKVHIAGGNHGDALSPKREQLSVALSALENVTQQLTGLAKYDPNACGAAANNYLHLVGYVSFAYMWLLMAEAATAKLESESSDFASAKLACADYYFECMLPRIDGLVSMLTAESKFTMAMPADWF